MMYLPNHTTKRRSVLTFNDLRYFMQAKRIECALLVNRSTYFALYLLDLYCCHV